MDKVKMWRMFVFNVCFYVFDITDINSVAVFATIVKKKAIRRPGPK